MLDSRPPNPSATPMTEGPRTQLRYLPESPDRAMAKPSRSAGRPIAARRTMHRVFAGLSEPCTATGMPAPKARAATTDVQTRPRASRRAGPFYLANEPPPPRPSSRGDQPIRDSLDGAQGAVRTGDQRSELSRSWRAAGGGALDFAVQDQSLTGPRTLGPSPAMCDKLLVYKDKNTAHIAPFILPNATPHAPRPAKCAIAAFLRCLGGRPSAPATSTMPPSTITYSVYEVGPSVD